MSSFTADLFSLDGRVALVSGASSGIGRQMATTLARAGAAVVLVARRRDNLDAATRAIVAAGGRAHAIAADVMDLDGLDGLVAEASSAYGAPDILINAAGVNPRLPAEALTPGSWNATVTLNLSAPFFLARAAVPGMIAKGYGNIINIASLQSYRAFPNGIAYGASKGGITQLTRAMAEAWSRHGIVANAIAPGFFPTELTAPVFADAAVAEHHAKMTAIGRNGALADLDGATVFLASRASAYITGQTLGVDGGYMAK
jgi:NAD(P)-dependent dehydrogenase (short-subunit alcohol dehydrogenase family)